MRPRSANGELGDADFGLHYIGLSGTDVDGRGRRASRSTASSHFDRGACHVAAVRRRRHRAHQDARHDRERHERRLVPVLQSCTTPRSRVSARTSCTRCRCPTSCATAAAAIRSASCRFDVAQYLDALRALDGQPILDENGDPTGEVYDSSLTAPEFNPVQSYDVEEDTIALYVSANFGADTWFANVGVRWITTDTTARTAIDSHRVRRRSDAGGPDLEPRRHLQPGASR